MSSMPVDTDITEQESWQLALCRAVRGLRYGSVELVIHDGRVVQIERREKLRLEPNLPRPDNPERGSHDRRGDRSAGAPDLDRRERSR